MATAIYCRVSSREQAEEGSSLESQETACRKYAADHGLSVFNVYADAWTVSAGAPDETVLRRPALDRMRDDIGAGLITDVICHKWDRLAAGIAQTMLVMEFYKAGINLHLCDGGQFDYNSLNARTMMGFMQTVNDLRVELIREGVRRGRRNKAAVKGRVTLNDVAPYGYALVGEKLDWLEVIPAEAKIVRRIYEVYVSGGSSSLTAVCESLKGTPTPSDSGHGPSGFAKGHKKAAGIWNESSIRAILESRLYAFGEWVYGKTEIRWTRDRVRTAPEARVIVSGLPTIVAPELWERAQQRLKDNRSRRDKTRKNDYPLSGFIKCGECGLSFTGFTTHYTPRGGERRSYRYYSCTGREKKRMLDDKTPRCRQRNIRADHLEKIVAEELEDIRQAASASGREAEWIKVVQKRLNQQAKDTLRLKDYAAEIAEVEAKRARYMNALEITGAGESAKAIAKKMKALDDEEKRLRKEQGASQDAEATRYTLQQVRELWQQQVVRLPDMLAKFFSQTGSVVVIHPAGWEGRAARTPELVLGAKAQSGVPVCLTIDKTLDIDKWGNIVDEGGHPVG